VCIPSLITNKYQSTNATKYRAYHQKMAPDLAPRSWHKSSCGKCDLLIDPGFEFATCLSCNERYYYDPVCTKSIPVSTSAQLPSQDLNSGPKSSNHVKDGSERLSVSLSSLRPQYEINFGIEGFDEQSQLISTSELCQKCRKLCCYRRYYRGINQTIKPRDKQEMNCKGCEIFVKVTDHRVTENTRVKDLYEEDWTQFEVRREQLLGSTFLVLNSDRRVVLVLCAIKGL
jgi:hypothetical protein